MELGLHREQYGVLVRELEEQGHSVELERPMEQRGVPEATIGEAYALVVQVAGFVDDHLLDAIVGALVARLLSRREAKLPPRRAAIYGPRGRILREVELPSEDVGS
jgi:hypothetical protein